MHTHLPLTKNAIEEPDSLQLEAANPHLPVLHDMRSGLRVRATDDD
jgi:hypothetical protein